MFARYSLWFALALCLLTGSVRSEAPEECQFNYQCEDAPYRVCEQYDSQCYSLPGIGIDRDEGRIYWFARCGARQVSPFDNGAVFVHSVDLNGSDYQVATRVSEDARSVWRFQGMTSTHFYYRSYTATSQIVTALHRDTLQATDLWTINQNLFASEFDEQQGKTFTCTNDIKSYPVLVDEPSDLEQSHTIFAGGCVQIVKKGSLLYWVTYDGASGSSLFFAGPAYGGGVGGIFSHLGFVYDFQVTDTHFYYSTSTGIHEVPLNGDTREYRRIISGSTEGLVVHEGVIYFRNFRYQIEAVNIDGTDRRVVSPRGGHCVCSPGFMGEDCQACGGVVQWNSGQPTCVPIGDNGLPSACAQDAQCGNAPFTRCLSGACFCAENFHGPECDQCDGVVRWREGYPVCVVVDPISNLPSSCQEGWECGNYPYTLCQEGSCVCAPGFGSGEKCTECAAPKTVSWNNGIPSCA